MSQKICEKTYILLWLNLSVIYLLLQFNQSKNIGVFFEVAILLLLPVVSILVKDRIEIAIQTLFIVLFISTIWFFCAINKYVHKNHKVVMLTGGLVLLLSTIVLLKSILGNINYTKIKKIFCESKWFIVITILFIVLVIPCFYVFPMGDGYAYYNEGVKKLIYNFDYTFSNIRDFTFYTHNTIGFALITLFAESIYPYTGVSLRLVNLIIVIFSAYLLLLSNKKTFPKINNGVLTIATTIYLFSPFIFGVFGQMDVDTPMPYIMVIIVSSYILKLEIIELFFSFVLINSKEPNVAYYCFFLLAIFIIEYCKKSGNFVKKVLATLGILKYRILLVIYWIYIFIFCGGWADTLKKSFVEVEQKDYNLWDVEAVANLRHSYHTLGFNLWNFKIKLKQMFVLNFNWIFVLIIVLFVVIYFKNRKRNEKNISKVNKGLVCYSFFAIGVLFVNTFYLDYHNNRYICMGNVAIILVGIEILLAIYNDYSLKKESIILMIIINILVIAESYITIDPCTRFCFEKAAIKYDNNCMIISADEQGNSDYNREQGYQIRCVDEILKEADLSENDLVVYNNVIHHWYSDKNEYWDKKNKMRVLSSNKNSFLIQAKIVENDYEDYEIDSEKYAKIVEIYPYTQDLTGADYKVKSCGTMKMKYVIRK